MFGRYLVVLFLGSLVCVNALSFLSNALGSNMVLQRAPDQANLWGWSSSAGSNIAVVFNNKQYATKSGAGGLWNVMLDPTPAGGPYTIQVTSSAGEKATLENVLFGDVYVCSGQSNMQFTVHSSYNATDEIRRAANYPNIRVFTVGQGTSSATPLLELATIEQAWAVASPQSIGVGDWNAFSATCWFFGRDLYDNIQVPIGLFSDNWGGTPVQAWSSADALKKCPGEMNPTEKVGGPNDPSNLWNAMILPVLSMTIKGALWYQGESNSGQPNYYACGFPAMIADWRAKWGGTTSKTFPFYYVQLAPWLNGDTNSEPLTRLSQLYANTLPRVGFATAADLGDPLSPYGSIHPRGKQEIGRRLALAARGISYGQTVSYLGPMATSYTAVSGTSVRVDFDPNTLGGGLTTVPVSCDPNVPAAQCAEYELGTAQGWVKATGTISGNSVVVSASVSGAITGVRYGHNNYPLMSLQNRAGLPAIPFMFPNPIKP